MRIKPRLSLDIYIIHLFLILVQTPTQLLLFKEKTVKYFKEVKGFSALRLDLKISSSINVEFLKDVFFF